MNITVKIKAICTLFLLLSLGITAQSNWSLGQL